MRLSFRPDQPMLTLPNKASKLSIRNTNTPCIIYLSSRQDTQHLRRRDACHVGGQQVSNAAMPVIAFAHFSQVARGAFFVATDPRYIVADRPPFARMRCAGE